jgi:rhodanese-related sulfurtransferase
MEHLNPRQAYEFLQSNPDAVLIDCRSEVEFLFVGHPVGAVHVAWSEAPDWDINTRFAEQVRNEVEESRPVVLICRSGTRSVAAGEALEKAGFRTVINVLEGFEGDRDEHHHRGKRGGWRFHGLPWEQT